MKKLEEFKNRIEKLEARLEELQSNKTARAIGEELSNLRGEALEYCDSDEFLDQIDIPMLKCTVTIEPYIDPTDLAIAYFDENRSIEDFIRIECGYLKNNIEGSLPWNAKVTWE